MTRPRYLSGLALIVVVGVLGLLAVLGVAFVTMAQLERKASEQRVHASKAALLARAGLEHALAALDRGQDPAYGGEDWNGNGALDGLEISAQAYQAGRLNQEDCPLRHALRPSLYVRDPLSVTAAPMLRKVEGFLRGYSGRLSWDGAADGNLYALKLEDESAKINVNGGLLDALDRDGDGKPDHRDTDPGRGWNAQLTRVLGILGTQLGIPAMGTVVVGNRPRGGYRSLRELQALMGVATDLSAYLTVSSWVDLKVVHPNENSLGGSMKDVQRARGTLALEAGGRPPVNLNAAPRPVLVALLQDLGGADWQGDARAWKQIGGVTAGAIADKILLRRPFATWGDFGQFCDTLVSEGTISGMSSGGNGGNLSGADLLKANFNPNSDLNKCLPDQLLWRWIDKSDLSVWSTEGNLGSTGTFRISSVGRLLGPGGRLLAERIMTMKLEAYRPIRQTTQQDFVAGRSALDSYLSLNTDPDPYHRTTGTWASWGTWGAAPRAGLAAVTYPCPPSALPGKAADFDGCVGLATLEIPNVNPAVYGGTLRFLHHFDDGWTADSGASPGRVSAGSESAFLQVDPAESVWPASPANPNTVYPDGVHLQPGCAPAFGAAGNLPPDAAGNHGVLLYWLKPMLRNGINIAADVAIVRGTWPSTQAFVVGRTSDGYWGICVESAFSNSDDAYEREEHLVYGSLASPTNLQPGARWQLVCASFDTDTTLSGAGDAEYSLRGLRGGQVFDSLYTTPFDPAVTSDLTAGGTQIILGRSDFGFFSAASINAVLDEFAIYDFGDAAGTAWTNGNTWAQDRYGDGRYYKRDDASFRSATLSPQPGASVRLLSACWTGYLPRETRQEIPAVSPLPVLGSGRLIDATLANARIDVDLLDASGAKLQALSPGAPIARTLAGFGYRVCFKNILSDPDKPVLETPFLDDITFFYRPASGPRLLAWESP